MIPPFVADGLVVRTLSAKGGKGVFTTRLFNRGELLVIWGGNIVSSRGLRYLSREQRRYALQVDDDLHLVTPIDKVGPSDFINHSCTPNAGLSDAVSLVALRHIRAGEEICFDYATSDSNMYSEFVCRCGRPACRRFITRNDWRRADLRRRYGDAFSPYLLRRIGAEIPAHRSTQSPHQRRAQFEHALSSQRHFE